MDTSNHRSNLREATYTTTNKLSLMVSIQSIRFFATTNYIINSYYPVETLVIITNVLKCNAVTLKFNSQCRNWDKTWRYFTYH